MCSPCLFPRLGGWCRADRVQGVHVVGRYRVPGPVRLRGLWWQVAQFLVLEGHGLLAACRVGQNRRAPASLESLGQNRRALRLATSLESLGTSCRVGTLLLHFRC